MDLTALALVGLTAVLGVGLGAAVARLARRTFPPPPQHLLAPPRRRRERLLRAAPLAFILAGWGMCLVYRPLHPLVRYLAATTMLAFGVPFGLRGAVTALTILLLGDRLAPDVGRRRRRRRLLIYMLVRGAPWLLAGAVILGAGVLTLSTGRGGQGERWVLAGLILLAVAVPLLLRGMRSGGRMDVRLATWVTAGAAPWPAWPAVSMSVAQLWSGIGALGLFAAAAAWMVLWSPP